VDLETGRGNAGMKNHLLRAELALIARAAASPASAGLAPGRSCRQYGTPVACTRSSNPATAPGSGSARSAHTPLSAGRPTPVTMATARHPAAPRHQAARGSDAATSQPAQQPPCRHRRPPQHRTGHRRLRLPPTAAGRSTGIHPSSPTPAALRCPAGIARSAQHRASPRRLPGVPIANENRLVVPDALATTIKSTSSATRRRPLAWRRRTTASGAGAVTYIWGRPS